MLEMAPDSVLVYLSSWLVNSVNNAYRSPGHSLFQLLLSIKINLLEYLTSRRKALIIFHNDVPNSHVQTFLEFLVNALSKTSHSKSAKHTYKNHTASPENFLYLLLSNT